MPEERKFFLGPNPPLYLPQDGTISSQVDEDHPCLRTDVLQQYPYNPASASSAHDAWEDEDLQSIRKDDL
jgi:hypothetical protein